MPGGRLKEGSLVGQKSDKKNKSGCRDEVQLLLGIRRNVWEDFCVCVCAGKAVLIQ